MGLINSNQNKECPLSILKGYRDEIYFLEKREKILIRKERTKILKEQFKEILKKILDLEKSRLKLEEKTIKEDIDSFTINRKRINNIEELMSSYKKYILLIEKRNTLLSKKIEREVEKEKLWSEIKDSFYLIKTTNCVIYKEILEEEQKKLKELENILKQEGLKILRVVRIEQKKSITGREILKIREEIMKDIRGVH